jgi:glucose/arabinose dehydrogenase
MQAAERPRRLRRTAALVLVLVAAAALTLGAGPSGRAVPGTTRISAGVATAAAGKKSITVKVVAKDFSYTLSRRSVPKGATVRFVVRNGGQTPHDFVIGTTRTRRLAPGQTQTVTVSFPRAGTFAFLCSVPGHAKLGMRGRFAVARPAAPPPPPPPPVVVSDDAVLTEVGTFVRPVFVTAPPGDTHRVFIVEHAGRVLIARDGVVLPTPFLDIRDKVKAVNEPGFQSIAFAPDYATSGLVYVFYNMRRGNGDLRLVEYRVQPKNPDVLNVESERVVLEITKPWENHNGGMMQFGPDGMLYISVGDGDSGVLNPPGAFAQTRDDLLGNILRIDPRSKTPYAVPDDNPFVNEVGVKPEIWAYGLRNPWRFWIDAETNTMLIGDVGLGEREEIDAAPLGRGGFNFGWPCFEGTLLFNASATCVDPVPPIWEQAHDDNSCSVIGGVVIHDPRLPTLAGRFIFGDYCTGLLSQFPVTALNTPPVKAERLDLTIPALSSFGVDGLDRVYGMSTAGNVYRLDPAP